MIYGASLGPFVKKALIEKGFQTNVSKIIETLPIDPAISNMDAVILSPKDMSGALGKGLVAAIQRKHPSIEIIYFYQKDQEAEAITGEVRKIKVGKVNLEEIQAGLNQTVELQSIGSDNRIISSGDNKTYSASRTPPFPLTSVDETILLPVEGAALEPEVIPESEPQPGPRRKTLEQRVLEMGQYADFDFFRQSLQKDQVLSDLMSENIQYAGLVNVLDAFDQQIARVFKNESLTAESRFDQLKQIGIDRSAYVGLERGMLADKIIAIMEAIVSSAEATVEARVDQVREALGTVATIHLVYQDREKLQTLVDSRLSIQMDLMELSKEIIEVYMAMDRSVTELLEVMNEQFPSKNTYVNELMKPIQPLFLPQNIGLVTNKLIGDLQKNKVALSIVEEKIKKLITLVFKLCEEDATLIDYQQKLINILLAQRVEDVVIVDNLIKNALRVFVGPAETGRTSTALTWSGVVSRRQNTLLLDLTGTSKLRQYGMEPISLDEFLSDRLERPFVCIEGDLEDDPDRADFVVSELKMRLNYYAHINVILDSTQTVLLNRLAKSALSVHFITDCTPRGTKLLKQTVEAFHEDNVARKVILIDPPIDPFRVLEDLSVDPLLAKIIIIPRLQYIRACSLNHARPFDNRDIVDVFEEAFR
ncbi:hypothetical protein [Cohnella lupini]|uniref:Uncharacterized protein n=1 Tax=Cohnella lupini TaxID=1294267 RepID=A0A3D9HV92_9BACL|nr:hypothetical protein [Cohnella lupini]RED52816.1 hypothetical protein DFP95_13020 [Cohnella lupini]